MTTTDVRPAELFTELAGIRELIDSDVEVDPKMDVVVGKLPEVLKRLYTLWQKTENLFKELSEKEEIATEPREAIIAHCQACRAEKKTNLLEDWFFLCLRDEFNLWNEQNCPDIGIRKGFLVVRLNDKAQEEVVEKRKSGVLVIGIAGGQESGKKFCQN